MKVPFSWLKEFVDIDVTAQELEEKLFSCGFEVEELIPLDAGISKVVVGKIVDQHRCRHHEAGRLRAYRTGWLHPARRHHHQGPQDAGRGV